MSSKQILTYKIRVSSKFLRNFQEALLTKDKPIENIVTDPRDREYKIITFSRRQSFNSLEKLSEEHGIEIQCYNTKAQQNIEKVDSKEKDEERKNIELYRLAKRMGRLGMINELESLKELYEEQHLSLNEEYVLLKLKVDIADIEDKIIDLNQSLKRKKDLLIYMLQSKNKKRDKYLYIRK